jgi:DNA-binding MarR family transcriptional regulator
MAKPELKLVSVRQNAPADGGLDEIVGLHIRLAHGAVYRHFTETFSDIDLTQKQVSVLWLLNDHPAMAQTDLARHLQMDRATTMAIVNRLQSRGYLVRGQSHSDRRKQTLSLTASGCEALTTAKAAIAQHESWLKARFSDNEVKTLIELLTRIHG